MAKALKNPRFNYDHHPSSISGSPASSQFVVHEVNEVKLCRLVDTAFEKIQELQGLCQQVGYRGKLTINIVFDRAKI